MTRIPNPERYSTESVWFDREHLRRTLDQKPFVPHAAFRSGHAQTIFANLRRRRFPPEILKAERREFSTEPEVRVVGLCSWQPDRRHRPTVLIIHGLEGSSEGSYVLGTASKAFARGFNVIRYNVRNCGGTEHLTPTLYHSGLTIDLHFVLQELIGVDGLSEIFVVGFSMGGNQALKMAGELGSQHPAALKGVCAISPPLDLEHCSRSIGERRNFIYEYRFLRSLRQRIRTKQRLFPGKYDFNGLDSIRSLWDFDELLSPYYGFQSALDYYTRASSRRFIGRISLPTLIIHAQDDPFIPMTAFSDDDLRDSPWVVFLNPSHGGHVAFFGAGTGEEDRAWAENRAVEFCCRVRESSMATQV